MYQGQHGWLSTDNPSVLSFEEKKGRHRGISSFVILVLVNRKGTSLQTLGFVTVLYFRAQYTSEPSAGRMWAVLC